MRNLNTNVVCMILGVVLKGHRSIKEAKIFRLFSFNKCKINKQ